ncbi:hypothetical protein BESB_011290 [Besnoitia besnoiti]|uniref:Isochorismatase-like domain-containing protein n=1 Tax=Besnoitia besnoiti TaxID=94643 RepID=A0A2A9MQX3_BESBE|nr:hypothetical protein BESB_011290 [Besnoitia besnoiti]PFH38787.1 hypothetical protein BESB_011290 [Besnoitia besnoiti]
MCTPSVVKALSEPPFAKRTSALLLGIEGHVCIQQTCLDLLEQGYDVHLLVDGIASQRLEKSGVFIATAEAVLFELMHDSIYERFKEVSRLIVESNRAACAAVET